MKRQGHKKYRKAEKRVNKYKNSVLVNFRADEATLAAIDKLAAAYVPEPGDLSGGGKSRAIREAILAAAAQLDGKNGGER